MYVRKKEELSAALGFGFSLSVIQNTKTKTYTVNPPAAGVTKAHIKIVKTDDNGESVVLDEQKSLPFSVPISGSGDGQITCYIDGVQMWSDAF